MNKKLISKLLAVAVITTGLGFTTAVTANAATDTAPATSSETKSDDYIYPVILQGQFLTENPSTNHVCEYKMLPNSGSGSYKYDYKVTKDESTFVDGEFICETRTEDPTFSFIPREAGSYRLVARVTDKVTGKTNSWVYTAQVKDSNQSVSAPSNLKLEYLSDDVVRLSWDASTFNNCSLDHYAAQYCNPNWRHNTNSTKNCYKDFTLRDEAYYVYVETFATDGVMSTKSEPVLIPAKLA